MPTGGGHHPGHYLAHVAAGTGALSVLDVSGLREELQVYLDSGELRADHAFWLFGLPFLTLRYTIRRR
ncbi:MAG: hypothetical protein WD080_09805 [Egibacteraceae bacterium]